MTTITDKIRQTLASIAPSIYPVQPGDAEVAHLLQAILRIKGIQATVHERGRTIDKDGAYLLLVNVSGQQTVAGQPAALGQEPYIGRYNGSTITLYKVDAFWDKKSSALLDSDVDMDNVMEVVL
jgi:hypothetical protein